METRLKATLIIILENIPTSHVLIFRLEEKAILRCDLKFHLSVGLRACDFVVRPKTVVIQEFGIERITEISENPILRGRFTDCTTTQVSRCRTDTKTIGLE